MGNLHQTPAQARAQRIAAKLEEQNRLEKIVNFLDSSVKNSDDSEWSLQDIPDFNSLVEFENSKSCLNLTENFKNRQDYLKSIKNDNFTEMQMALISLAYNLESVFTKAVIGSMFQEKLDGSIDILNQSYAEAEKNWFANQVRLEEESNNDNKTTFYKVIPYRRKKLSIEIGYLKEINH